MNATKYSLLALVAAMATTTLAPATLASEPQVVGPVPVPDVDTATFMLCSSPIPLQALARQRIESTSIEVPGIDIGRLPSTPTPPPQTCGVGHGQVTCTNPSKCIPQIEVGGPGNIQTACHATNSVCAMAGADAHIEVIGGAPDMAVMMTAGGGQSNTPVGGHADIETSLGSGSCNFAGNSGCALDWSEIRQARNCGIAWARTVATSLFVATVSAVDPIC